MKAEIELHGTGRGSVSLDGVNISHGIRGGTLAFGVHELPVLTLDLAVHEGVSAGGQAVVRVPEKTRDLLIQLGWTPPVLVESPSDSEDRQPTGPPVDG